MRTVQMTLDDDLVKTVDNIARKMHTTRSEFTRLALRRALKRIETIRLEERHHRGYAAAPVTTGEFSVWEKEQQWGDE